MSEACFQKRARAGVRCDNDRSDVTSFHCVVKMRYEKKSHYFHVRILALSLLNISKAKAWVECTAAAADVDVVVVADVAKPPNVQFVKKWGTTFNVLSNNIFTNRWLRPQADNPASIFTLFFNCSCCSVISLFFKIPPWSKMLQYCTWNINKSEIYTETNSSSLSEAKIPEWIDLITNILSSKVWQLFPEKVLSNYAQLLAQKCFKLL